MDGGIRNRDSCISCELQSVADDAADPTRARNYSVIAVAGRINSVCANTFIQLPPTDQARRKVRTAGGVEWISAKPVLPQVREPVSVGIQVGIIGVERIETMSNFPAVRHAVAV